jgi:hypothetical protein
MALCDTVTGVTLMTLGKRGSCRWMRLRRAGRPVGASGFVDP